MNKPLYIVWRDACNIGVPVIDEQHRGIITTINSLYYFLEQGYEVDFLKPTIDITRVYMGFHFATEKELLEKANYPGIEEDRLARIKLFTQFKQASTYKDPKLLLKFLLQWWINHINVEHKVYARFLTPHV